MKITKRQLRRIISEAIGSGYAGRYADVSSHGGGYGNYRNRQQGQEREWARKAQEKDDRDEKRRNINTLKDKVREIFKKTPDISEWGLCDELGYWCEDEEYLKIVEDLWAQLKAE